MVSASPSAAADTSTSVPIEIRAALDVGRLRQCSVGDLVRLGREARRQIHTGVGPGRTCVQRSVGGVEPLDPAIDDRVGATRVLPGGHRRRCRQRGEQRQEDRRPHVATQEARAHSAWAGWIMTGSSRNPQSSSVHSRQAAPATTRVRATWFECGWPHRSSARGGTRTHTPFRTTDFESVASAIPPLGRVTRTR